MKRRTGDMSEKFLISEFSSLRNQLSNYKTKKLFSSEWDKRLEAIRTLTKLLTPPEIFKDQRIDLQSLLISSGIAAAIGQQLEDLRSSVIKETCLLISTISTNMALNPIFDQFALHVISPMLKLCFVTIKIISNSAQDCLSKMVKRNNITKTFRMIIKANDCSNGLLRKLVVSVVLDVLSDNILFKRYFGGSTDRMEETRKVICTNLTDAVGDIRKLSRRCFHQLQSRVGQSDDVTWIFQNVPAHVQKILQREEMDDSSEFECPSSGNLVKKEKSSVKKKGGYSSRMLKRFQFDTNFISQTPTSPASPKRNRKPKKIAVEILNALESPSTPINSPKRKFANSSLYEVVESPLVLSDANSTDWSTRLAFFTEIHKRLSNHKKESSSSTGGPLGSKKIAKKCLSLCIQKLEDNHYKIVLQSLSCLSFSLKIYKKLYEKFLLDTLVKSLYLKANHPKERIRKKVNTLLAQLGEVFDNGILIGKALKFVGSTMGNPSRNKVGNFSRPRFSRSSSRSTLSTGCNAAIESVLYLIPSEDTKKWLKTNMGEFVEAMALILKKKKDLKDTIYAVLLSLTEHCNLLFLQQINFIDNDSRLCFKEFFEKFKVRHHRS